MIAPAVLVIYAALMGIAGPRWLRRAHWLTHAPRLALALWTSLIVSIVLAVGLTGVSLALPELAQFDDLATFLDACLTVLRGHYQTPAGVTTATVGLALVGLVTARLMQVLARQLWLTRRHRGEHRRAVLLLGHRHRLSRAVVLPHPVPAAYCLPGRGGVVVVTSAALATLSPDQTAAVLAHEEAHLRGRHHLLLAFATAVRAAFPFVPAFSCAQHELARLVEMRADDAAVETCERRELATALALLASAAVPAGAVAAGGGTAVFRAQRLASTAAPIGRRRAALIIAVTAAMLVLPLVIAVSPAVAASALHYCPLDLASYGR